MIQKAIFMKEKLKYLTSPKLRMLAPQKVLFGGWKDKQATDFEKTFINHIPNKRHISNS